MEKQKENNVLKVLSELVSIPSFGKIKKNHPIIQYLKNSFRDCYETLEIEDSNGNVHLLVGINHELKNINDSILLSGHIDTVVESQGHSCNISFEANKINGLGTSDMKSFIATIISNIENLRYLDIPIVLSITSDEETNLKGINKIINELKIRNINSSFVIVGEPTDLDYYVSSRGNSVYVDIMKGISCHSGTPELGVNAIELIADFVTEIKKISKKYEKEAAVCITSIKGGKTPSNVVPDECSICFGIRTSNSIILNTMYNQLAIKHKEISRNNDDSILFNVVNIPPFERKKSEFIINQSNINEKKVIDARYATEAGFFQLTFPNANIVIYGPGNPECIHKAGESIDINNLLQYNAEFLDMINNYLDYINNNKKENNNKKLIYIPNK